MAVHDENEQLPREQQLEPPKRKPHQATQQQAQQITQQPVQQMALFMSELQIAKQQFAWPPSGLTAHP